MIAKAVIIAKEKELEESSSSDDSDLSVFGDEALICLVAKDCEVSPNTSKSDSEHEHEHEPTNLYNSIMRMVRDFQSISQAHTQLKDENSRLKSEGEQLTEQPSALDSQIAELEKLESKFNELR